MLQRVEAGHIGQAEIQDHGIGLAASNFGQAQAPGLGFAYEVAARFQRHAEQSANLEFIVEWEKVVTPIVDYLITLPGVDPEAIRNHPDIEITHINLNDESIEGIRMKGKPAFSVQYHPESTPGPYDSRYLFDDFIKLIEEYKMASTAEGY